MKGLFTGLIKGLDMPLLWPAESVLGSPEHEGDELSDRRTEK